MAQQTAIEQFIKSFIERDRLINPNSCSIQIYFEGNKDLIKQAKEIEKQQIESAWKRGDGEHDKVADELSKKYYTETYTK
jgi:hypothetical protein